MNLLIVDDEKQIREGIKKYITKKNFKFKQISTAKDATEALQISTHFRPDLLITDIAMPKIDGIELATRMKVLFPDVKIVMITGFQEIDFMKRAFKLSVIDYLLKPIDLNELNPVLERIVSIYETETAEKAEISSLKGKWRDNIAVLREAYMVSLLSGKIQNTECVISKMKQLLIGLDLTRSMVVVNIRFDCVISLREPTLSQVMEIIEGTFRRIGTCAVFQMSETEIIGVISPHCMFADNDRSLDNVCYTLLDILKNRYSVGITIGIGSLADDCLALADSYSASLEAVNQRFILGNGHVIIYPVSYMKVPLIFIPQQALVEKLILYIQAADCQKVKDVIHLILKPLSNCNFVSSNEIQMIRLELVSLVKQIFRKINTAMPEQHHLGELLELQTLNEIEQRLVILLLTLCEYFQQQGKKKSAHIISKVMEMTETRYNEPLNVQYVAECMQISPNYFSTLFKQETGNNYMDYLTTMRLEKSLAMILNTTYRISEIACMVGYQDANYFAKIFKKHFGISPSQYREGDH
ncbi:response regulator [Paenibacillus agricola]|uniref:Response regulator n=1 Tax=Paenibacillus agricola TaxID=2716264 RepID=A0ABX0JE89_9BACL|nr:response regulator [Paenibacillus agricola]NHN33715.1 response regulator [Paenibacillus agricola]